MHWKQCTQPNVPCVCFSISFHKNQRDLWLNSNWKRSLDETGASHLDHRECATCTVGRGKQKAQLYSRLEITTARARIQSTPVRTSTTSSVTILHKTPKETCQKLLRRFIASGKVRAKRAARQDKSMCSGDGGSITWSPLEKKEQPHTSRKKLRCLLTCCSDLPIP